MKRGVGTMLSVCTEKACKARDERIDGFGYIANTTRYQLLILSIFIIVSILGGGPLHAEDLDTRLGAEAAAQVEAQMGLADHARATEYIEKIGQRLVANLEDKQFEYKFHVVDMAAPNAFALPGGYIYFSRGILLVANSEDELAGVMGHEIIHSHNRHSVKTIKRSIGPSLLKLPGNMVGALISPRLARLINSPVEGISGLTLASYGRKHESESDRLGADLAARAGYDPRALGSILTSLSNTAEAATGKQTTFSYYDSHPFTPSRVDEINRISNELTVASRPPIASSKKAFYDQFLGLPVRENPAQGFFQENKFIHPILNFTLEFPKGWKTVNSPTHVGAYEPGKKAQLFLGLGDNNKSPEEHARAFIRELEEKFGERPSESRKVDVKGNQGYYVSLKDGTSRHPVTIHMLWLSLGKHMFEFIGAGYEAHRPAMRESVLSLRPITKEEWNSLSITVYRVVKAREGETLASLSKRSGNALSPDLTAAINSLSPDQRLSKGQLVKIGKKEPFRPARK
jgi:predicted Zn-dependent protease